MIQACDLLVQIEAFLRETHLGVTAFGARACGNGKLVNRLRSGQGCTLATAKRVLEFIQNHKGADE